MTTAIRAGKGLGQLVLEHVAAGRVGARFEHRPEPLRRVIQPQGLERLADRGGMMAEVIDHHDAARHAADFETPLDALETC